MKRTVTLFIALGLLIDTFSQIEFTKHIITSVASGASAVTAIDLDKDGDLDVISGDFNGNKISWYENNGSQEFEMHTIATGEVSAVWVMAIDLDRDGDVDVLSSTSDSDRLAWHENDGDQNFSTHLIATLDLAHMFDVADIDKDGDLDICEAAGLGDYTAWFENDGNQNFKEHIISTSVRNPQQVQLADIDEDGDIDAFSASAFNNYIVWHKNDGNQNFENINLIRVQDPTRLHIIDLDGDNDLDILVGLGDTGQLNWYENDGNENFTAHIITKEVLRIMRIDAADLDNDGDLDVLIASREDNLIAWYENDGDQNFTTHILSNTAKWALSVFATDVDNDGDLDILSASVEDNTVAWYENDLSSTPNSPQFFKYDDNPIIPVGNEGAWDAGGIAYVHVLKIKDTYHMWYSATPIEDYVSTQIGYASSTDGLNWVKFEGNPVLTLGDSGKFDDEHASMPWVIYEDSIFKMWYTGDPNPNGGAGYKIGFATAPNPTDWTKYNASPVLSGGGSGQFDAESVFKPIVIKRDSMYQMWYSGSDGNKSNTGYATSFDGINWSKYENNPVLSTGQGSAWDSNVANASTVLYHDGKYRMWYHGNNIRAFADLKIGYAESLNGIYWYKAENNPILQPSSNEWDQTLIWFPCVIKNSLSDTTFTYEMYYSGRAPEYKDNLGLASTDVITSEKSTLIIGDTPSVQSISYPNPFSSATTISYQLPVSGMVKISVYDLFGRELEVLVRNEQSIGSHQTEWNANGFPAGMYFYRLSIDGKTVEARKMIYTK